MSSVEAVAENRRQKKWTLREKVGRVSWALVAPLFRYSPRLCWGWRRGLLRLFGAKVGNEVHIHPTVRVFVPWNLEIGEWSCIGFDCLLYNLGPMKIGANVTVSQRSHLCGGTHDYRDPTMPLIKSKINIGDDVWICADSFVGPGVEIGHGAVVGARSVATRTVPPWTIVAGNPARIIGSRERHESSAPAEASTDGSNS